MPGGSAPDRVELAEWFLDRIPILVVLVAAIVLSVLARLAVRRMERRIMGEGQITEEQRNLQRAATLTQALSYTVQVTIWTIALLLILGNVGVNLGPLLAGAGIAGVALGFGAQSLVRDFLSGFFILLEDQYGVGDLVDVIAAGGMVTGKVETLSLRTTSIRAFDGTLHIVPNGNIQIIGNKSRGWARAIIDVGVAYGEDVEKVKEVLEELFGELAQDEELAQAFLETPRVLGVERLGEYDVVLRVVAETAPSARIRLERELRRRIKLRFDERGIESPLPRQVVISPGDGSGEGEADAPS
jgi:moderate conductance mechanosensitive channel